MAAERRRVRVGVDTGGTFTDAVAVDEATGALVTTKTPSTPADPAEGFLTAVRRALDLLGADGADLVAVSHGTTVATNQLLEGRLGDLGFVTTEGFAHLLEIARQSVPDGYGNSYFWVKPPRIVPADRVRTVAGRLDPDGAEVRPFDEPGAVAVARWLRDRGVDTVGVCFLHAYANPAHERRMREVLAREHPAATVSLSHEVLAEYREYERSMTTLVDAAVKPGIRRYLARLTARLADLVAGSGGAAVPCYVMKSNGGVLSADEVVHQPISTVLSGPAAGALGAAVVAGQAGVPSVLTLDGGGTSTDVAVVVDGQPALTTEGTVGGYPCRVPMVDVVTVGAGGGSVAWFGPDGALKVGPRSAGAEPGPLCYGRGGSEPTVTDAHLVLGRIPPHLLGGEVPLDPAAARAGLAALADRLGGSVEQAAAGVLELSAWTQANALRQVTVARGVDVRDFTLVTFGGSGSLLACRLVDLLGLRGVLVPLDPGNLSAYGLLTVDVRNYYVRTAVSRHRALDVAATTRRYADLHAAADAALAREGFPPERRRFLRSADLRYRGQAFEVRVPVADGPLTDQGAAAAVAAFHAEHRRLYGYDFRDDPRQEVEWVNLRVSGIGPIRRPRPRTVPPGAGAATAGRGCRPVWFDRWLPTPVYDRARLGAGDEVLGPAVVEEFGATVPVHPGYRARVDGHGNLLLGPVDTP